MAKKRAAASPVNVSAEIRDVLKEHPDYTGRQCLETVAARHPGVQINEKSFQVAFSNARKKMGIGRKGKRRVVKKKKPAATTARRTAPAPAVQVDFKQLQAAREYVAKVGSSKAAIAAIEKLNSLQIQ